MIAALLSQPEGRSLDFKREEVTMEKVLQTIVAFANTSGGRIVIGVADDKAVIGVRDVKQEEERYANAIDSGISPPLFPDLLPVTYEGKALLVISVPRQPGPFHMRKETEEHGTYVRLGSTNRRADDRKREELRQMASTQAFDARPCFGTSTEDLDQRSIDAAFAPTGRIPTGAMQETLGLVLRAGDERIPSNAGILLFGTDDARTRIFGSARFRAARFPGTTKTDPIDRFDPPGSVISSVDDVFAFVQRNTRLGSRIEGMRRIDIPQYGPVALREVLANAIAHADYSQRGMSLNVFVFADRIDVESPGGWPVGYEEEDFRQGISRQRNKVISDVLRRLDIAEHLGTGFAKIQSESVAMGYPVPEWIEAGQILRVRLRPHPDVVPESSVTHDDTDGGTDGGTDRGTDRGTGEIGAQASSTLRKMWFVERLRRGEDVRAESLVKAFRVSVRTARRDIADLQVSGRIAFHGTERSGRYVLTDD